MNNFLECLNTVFSNIPLSLILLAFLLYATYTDIRYLKIYNKFNLLIVLTRIAFIFLPTHSLSLSKGNIIASISAFSLFLIMAMIFMHRMGGDIKFIGAFMLFFNLEYMLVFCLIASVLNMFYAIALKMYLQSKKEHLIKHGKKGKERLLYLFVKIFLVRIPKDTDLVNMNNQDFNKYKLPFAPFFLMSYIITYILYLL